MFGEHSDEAHAAWFARGGGRGMRGMGGMGGGFGRGGFGGHGGGGFPFGRGPAPKVKRGDVRAAALSLLAEEPRNGYQIIQAIAEKSGGVWRPGSGSVYPALQQLEDEGLVRTEEVDGKRRYKLTDEGKAYVKAHKEELTNPWGEVAETVDAHASELHAQMHRLIVALRQVQDVGDKKQQTQAKQVISQATRALYQLLAGTPEDAEE